MKVLIKIGSALISKDNRIDKEWLSSKVDQMAMLYREGHQLMVVSSGAVAAGMEIQGLRARPRSTLELQLLSGQGQVRLSRYYKEMFKDKYIFTSQVLLTHHNFENSGEVSTLIRILREYMGRGVVPIINENDLVNKEELDTDTTFSDNDILSALVARTIGVDMVVILTNVDGLYPSAPGSDGESGLIEEVDRVTSEIRDMVGREVSQLGTGGMRSKIEAAEMLTEAGIPVIIGNGRYTLQDLLEAQVPRTLFHPKQP